MASENDSSQIFNNLSTKFTCILYGRTEKQKENIIKILDELNELNYKLPLVTNYNKAVLLIHQCCQVINPTDILLVEKCCTLIVNLLMVQKIKLEGKTLTFALEWSIQALKHSQENKIFILKCIESLIRDNVENIQELLPQLIGINGILLELSKPINAQEAQLWAVKCLEAISFVKDDQNIIEYNNKEIYLQTCFKSFLHLILSEKPTDCDEIIFCKLQISCLRGINSIIIQDMDIAHENLEILLGISKICMTYCLFDSDWIKPTKIMPSNLSIADIKNTPSRDKKGGKVAKQRKPRKGVNKKVENKKNDSVDKKFDTSSYTPATTFVENTNVVVSDSDFSDSETGLKNKITNSQGRIRQAALNLFLSLLKVTDKHTMFRYWSSFLSDGSPSSNCNLNQCLLLEPSPRGRIAVLNVISFLLNGSKPYFSQAESSTKTFAFTPFSMILGSVIQELHKCLCSALKDNFLPALTQTLKCLSLLVQASPYHKLSPGLVTDVITNVRPFIRHRDASVQVAALIVLGCIISSEPVIKETIQNLLIRISLKQKTMPEPNLNDIEYADFSSDEEETYNESETDLPWLLEKCLRNLGIKLSYEKNKTNIVPAPVKLESLQVISAMCRNYFMELLRPYLLQIGKALELSLADKYTDLKLHAGRTIDSIGQAMQLVIGTDEAKGISIERSLAFWQILLNGPLISLLQNEQFASLRSVGCDCLGSIGPIVFENLPKDKQIVVITLLFACSRDEDNNVIGAAVRALAISVLYPSLREDIGYVIDTAEAIIRTLNEQNVTVKIKSSWALGNLSDALVLNSNCETTEDLPDSILLKLLTSSIKIADDNDKIKSNAARALGNLLRLITSDLLNNDEIKNITECAIATLVKISTQSYNMKVRWNSCYAIGNFLKNSALYSNLSWQESVYLTLMNLVVNSNNFKVRINSALSLSIPSQKIFYGKYYFSVWKSLMDALDNSQHIEDLSEYKHRDNLVDQICMSLGHLATLLTIEDLKELQSLLDLHMDALNLQIRRVQERLVPEKSEIFIKAFDHINFLSTQRHTCDENLVVQNLLNMFKRDIV